MLPGNSEMEPPPDRPAPTPVLGIDDATGMSAGYLHTCVRRTAGLISCWGHNAYGQLGDGFTAPRSAPAAVVDLADATQVDGGALHTCARRSDGSFECWGSNERGQLGIGAVGGGELTPRSVRGLSNGADLALGGNHACVRRPLGEVLCWGSNDIGQVGDGTQIDRVTPTRVSEL